MQPEPAASPPDDPWARWLLTTRHGGDPAYARRIRAALEAIRDRVLDDAALKPGMTLVDAGCGDGLVGFGALERIGPSLRVVFADISDALVQHARREAGERGLLGSCSFITAPADRLSGLADAGADVVTTRAVLAYVPDKVAALREFHRVLRPGGRLSICEPIFRDNALEAQTLCRILAARPPDARDRRLRLVARWQAAQFPSTPEDIEKSPISNFSERNLVYYCQQAGFREVHLDLRIDHRRRIPVSWETFLNGSPHPLAPTLREIMAAHFTAEESAEFEGYLRPEIESDEGYERDINAYLTAVKT